MRPTKEEGYIRGREISGGVWRIREGQRVETLAFDRLIARFRPIDMQRGIGQRVMFMHRMNGSSG